MEDIKQILSAAIGTGELINIIYHGGSEPGAARMILPIEITGDKIRARCHKTNQVKSFQIGKMALSPSDKITYSGDKIGKEPATLTEAAETKYIEELRNLGWEVEIEPDAIRLYTHFKNGKRLKHPNVSLYYRDDYDGDELYYETENGRWKKLDPRPWKTGGRAYKYLGKAFDAFMIEARAQAPCRRAKLS